MMRRKWRYMKRHLPSGEVFEQETSVDYSLTEFLQLLNQWNQASDLWKYWAAGGEPVPRTQERDNGKRELQRRLAKWF